MLDSLSRTNRNLRGSPFFSFPLGREIDLASEDQRNRRSALGASKKTGEKFGGGSSFRSVRLRLEKGRKAKQIPKI